MPADKFVEAPVLSPRDTLSKPGTLGAHGALGTVTQPIVAEDTSSPLVPIAAPNALLAPPPASEPAPDFGGGGGSGGDGSGGGGSTGDSGDGSGDGGAGGGDGGGDGGL